MNPDTKILTIPLPGGSAHAPTGAVQFQNDWPGLFIRGDDAIVLRSRIRGLQQRLQTNEDVTLTCALLELGELADIIERNVMVGGHGPNLKPLE